MTVRLRRSSRWRKLTANTGILTGMDPKPLPRNDLREVFTLAEESFRTLHGARIFVAGGTGFFGHWLLESLLLADRELDLGVRATVLTRDAARFRVQ